MADNVDRTANNVANQHTPYAAPFATGISPDVRADLAKLGSEKKGRVLNVVAHKSGEQSHD